MIDLFEQFRQWISQPIAEDVVTDEDSGWFVYDDLDTTKTFDVTKYEVENGFVGTRRSFFQRISVQRSFLILIMMIVFVLCLYGIGYIYYFFHFYPRSMIGDVNVSGMTGYEAQQFVYKDFSDYKLVVHLREGDFTVTGDELHLDVAVQPQPIGFVRQQDAIRWGLDVFVKHKYEPSFVASYDELNARLAVGEHLSKLAENHAGQAASLSFQDDGSLLYIDGTVSTYRDDSICVDKVLDAVSHLETDLDLTDSDIYQDALTDVSNDVLENVATQWNLLRNTTLSYSVSGETKILSGDMLNDHLRLEDNQIQVSRAFLMDLLTSWYHFDDEIHVSYRNVDVGVPILDRVFNGYVDSSFDKLISDLRLHSTNGVLPDFDANNAFIACLHLELDIPSKTLKLVQNGHVIDTFSIDLTSLRRWTNMDACVASVSDPSNNVFVLSNGLRLGGTGVNADIIVSDLAAFLDAVDEQPICYIVFLNDGDDIDDAWNNQSFRYLSMFPTEHTDEWVDLFGQEAMSDE